MAEIVLHARRYSVGRRTILWVVVAGLILTFAIVSQWIADISDAPAYQDSDAPTMADPVTYWQAQIERDSAKASSYAQLGLALLQQVRETHDPTLYARAGNALDAALVRDSNDVDALTGKGMLALALHDFTGALRWADRVLIANSYRAAGYGIRVDALVELGRYAEAVKAAQSMVDLRPDLESYSRVSYLRELHGDTNGAIAAMEDAVKTAVPGTEPWLWTLTHLGNLWANRGNMKQAELAYRAVLQQRADYPYAQAGMARVLAARGDTNSAVELLQSLTTRLPMPEFLVQLGEIYLASGQGQLAAEQFDMVRVIQQLNRGVGMNVDLELASIEATYGQDPKLALALAEDAYAERPTIYAADAKAWALYRNGRYEEAEQYSQEALRLGTQDAHMWWRAGLIADALGNPLLARDHLAHALKLNPYFSPPGAETARATLTAIAHRIRGSATRDD